MARFVRFAMVAACAAATACGGPAPGSAAPAAPADRSTMAHLSGRVRFEGEAPPAPVLRIDGDRDCVTVNGTDRFPDNDVLISGDGGLQNVFVHVSQGLPAGRYPIPSEPVVIDQQKCRYVPRVIGVRVGQPLQVRNGDPLLHNVRADSRINQPFNQGQPVQGMAFTYTFTTREVMVPIKCDVHAWMRAWVGAMDHPFFAVTDEAGAFSLPDLPPGSYTIEAWHERLGTQTVPVTLAPGETNDVVFTFAR